MILELIFMELVAVFSTPFKRARVFVSRFSLFNFSIHNKYICKNRQNKIELFYLLLLFYTIKYCLIISKKVPIFISEYIIYNIFGVWTNVDCEQTL